VNRHGRRDRTELTRHIRLKGVTIMAATTFTDSKTEAAKKEAANDVQTLREDLAILKEDIASLTRNLGRNARGAAHEQADRVSHMTRRAAQDVQASAARQHGLLGETVSERPIATIAVAALAGAVLAKVCTR
jgi:ElaB/YqjD/DUF883 family membrane-anchored ribosome-binding protein